ncbi:LysM peptidoglycan-binding domain-containing protein [Oxalobacteraceae bacterium R-40]|uniref:LysM peptidoglycan-binding domain-containing protein n=1 Tax=Keguizhuia sedimenti TaxID=3064264 RepID=A0ABU1BJU9_9BURK|nr:LysM peptidoglycan-binding domain-containing protein [Oxalobacteraceae bacterium R-40]
MKKFSTAGYLFIFALSTGAVSFNALAADTAASTATKTTRCSFKANAPDKHKVVRGDTLWDISGKFLDHPWCWPQVWGLNRDQIRDPHWIYPGQIVYFDRAAGRLRLGTPAGDKSALPNVKLSPQVRTEGMGQDAIPAIPSAAIEPFLSQPLIVNENDLQTAARIVAVQEGRVFLGKGDKAYVRGDLKGGTSFQVFRPAKPLRHPQTKEILGYEAAYLGTVTLDRAAKAEDEAHRFIVSSSKEEMGIGDRLIPVAPTPILNYIPHAPATAVDARVVSVYGGVMQAGQNNVITISSGKDEGIDIGTVLHLYRFGGIIADRTDDKKPVKLPDEQYGTLFVFRVFDKLSYALVMQVTDAVQVGDVAKSPE